MRSKKNTSPKNNTVHHGMLPKVIDRSSMVCVEHDIKTGTFYNLGKRLRQKGCMDLLASTGRSYRAPKSQEVVRADFQRY